MGNVRTLKRDEMQIIVGALKFSTELTESVGAGGSEKDKSASEFHFVGLYVCIINIICKWSL